MAFAKPKGRITVLLHLLEHVVKAAFHLAALVLGLFTCFRKWVILIEVGWIGLQNKWHVTTITPLTRRTGVQKKIYLCNNPLVEKRGAELEYSALRWSHSLRSLGEPGCRSSWLSDGTLLVWWEPVCGVALHGFRGKREAERVLLEK